MVCLIYNFNSLFSPPPTPILRILNGQTTAERLRRDNHGTWRLAWSPPHGTATFTGLNGMHCTTGAWPRGSCLRFEEFKAVAMDIPRGTFFSPNDCCVW